MKRWIASRNYSKVFLFVKFVHLYFCLLITGEYYLESGQRGGTGNMDDGVSVQRGGTGNLLDD